jgi:small-conductance mechanosensitive channel
MNKIRTFIHYFITITTGILLITAVSFTIGSDTPTTATLWQILLSAGLTALATTIFFPDENASKRRIHIGLTLHIISLCAIMILCGRWFGWISSGFLPALTMVGYVLLVYAFTASTTYLISKKEVALMNAQLQRKFAQNADEDPA